MADSPFDSIESAHEYVGLLAGEVDDVKTALQDDIAAAELANVTRRLDALRIVDYKLKQLAEHLAATGRILNDLRTLRRLLVGEQEYPPAQDGQKERARQLM